MRPRRGKLEAFPRFGGWATSQLPQRGPVAFVYEALARACITRRCPAAAAAIFICKKRLSIDRRAWAQPGREVEFIKCSRGALLSAPTAWSLYYLMQL